MKIATPAIIFWLTFNILLMLFHVKCNLIVEFMGLVVAILIVFMTWEFNKRD